MQLHFCGSVVMQIYEAAEKTCILEEAGQAAAEVRCLAACRGLCFRLSVAAADTEAPVGYLPR